MNKYFSIILAGAMAIGLAGCGSSSKETADSGGSAPKPTPGTPSTGKKLKIGVVFDSGGRGDKSFNDSAWAGIERAQKEFGIEALPIESKTEKDYETNQSTLAESGADLIIAVGLNQETALKKVSAAFPNSKFAIVDGSVEAKNVRMLKFNEEEGSFLAGYLAGLVTTTNKIGFVGGMDIPLIAKFQYGYMAGAMLANPKIEILPAKFTGNWDDSQKGKASANILFSSGADIVYHAAGRAGQGVITAAKEANKYAIGVDSNQDDIAPGNVLTSMLKRVDEAVYATIKDLVEGKYAPGEVKYTLAQNGVGLSDMVHTKDKIGADKIAALEPIKQKIIAGEIKVPSTLAEFETFKQAQVKP